LRIQGKSFDTGFRIPVARLRPHIEKDIICKG
jgi:hypothetical protein